MTAQTTQNRRPAALLLSGAFGVLMVVAATGPAGAWALASSAAALAALLAGLFFRPAAVAAVLFTIAGIVLGDPVPVLAAVSGLSAAAYLISRYAEDAVTLTVPTVLGMVGFTVLGATAGAVSVRMTWLPLVAPAIMAAILILVVLPLVSEVFTAPAPDPEPPD